MSATSAPALPRVTQRRVFLSEWTKLRSVRSTRYALLAAVVLTIALAAGRRDRHSDSLDRDAPRGEGGLQSP